MTMAGRIGVMDAGRLAQVATPRELYEAPRSRWIAEFVGDINLLEGKRDGEPQTTVARRLAIKTEKAGTIHVAEPRESLTRDNLCVAIRPEKVKLSQRAPVSDDARAINRLEGVVTDVSYLGGVTSYKIKLDTGAVLRASMANTTRLDFDAYSPSQRVVAWFSPEDCVVLEQ
jgi:putrescine transport system ATP-binding protein